MNIVRSQRVIFDGAVNGDVDAQLYCLHSSQLEVYITDLGASIVALFMPNRSGEWQDIVLGFESAWEYQHNRGDFGGTIGRYAGRIADGIFPINDGVTRLVKNRPEGTIHGGKIGFHKQKWRVVQACEEKLVMELHSPDGDQGFPSSVDVQAAFTVQGEVLSLTLTQTNSGNRDTVCSMTNHTYWNLAGAGNGTVDNHQLKVNATEVLEVNRWKIPTGKILALAENPVYTAVDFREQAALNGRRCDHTCLLVPCGQVADQIVQAAIIKDPNSGRCMELWTDLPAVQVYTADGMEEHLGKNGKKYGPRTGFCLEPQYCPDSPNHLHFAQPLLQMGQTRTNHIQWKFSIE